MDNNIFISFSATKKFDECDYYFKLVVRRAVKATLEYLGIDFDHEANDAIRRPAVTTCISKPESAVKVYLIPTNEELIIAEDTEAVVSAK